MNSVKIFKLIINEAQIKNNETENDASINMERNVIVNEIIENKVDLNKKLEFMVKMIVKVGIEESKENLEFLEKMKHMDDCEINELRHHLVVHLKTV